MLRHAGCSCDSGRRLEYRRDWFQRRDNQLLVMAGLDPAIHLTSGTMDGRLKGGHDIGANRAPSKTGCAK
jgi:hypothetical protein